MKCISWNVNGFRAVYKRGDLDWLWTSGADLIFLQEVKAAPDQIDLSIAKGYFPLIAHSTVRKGYSGVATFSKNEPDLVEFGLKEPKFDDQGRVITTIFGNDAFINVYVPNGGGAIAPLPFKFEFLDTLLDKAEVLRSEGKSVFIGGDINIAHTAIDLARPQANQKSIGFLPEERAWLDQFFATGYADSFRYLNPRAVDAYTYWDNKSGARERNVGWRIDYWISNSEAVDRISSMKHLTQIYGSDHCPIEMSLKT